MQKELKIINNEEKLRFETIVGNDLAYIDYRWNKGAIVIMHTFVPVPYREKGVAAAMAKFALDYIKEKNLKLVVYCPYITWYMKRHPEYSHLLLNSN